MKRGTGLLLVALAAGLVVGGAWRASCAAGTNPWQLLDFKDKEVLAKIGITDETSEQMGIGILRNALGRHRDPEVRATCAKTLGRLDVKAAGQELTWALNDPSATVRNEAARALGVIGEKRAIGALSQLLKKEPSWENRMAIVAAFEALGDRRAGPVLAEALLKDPDWRVREKAAEALMELEEKRASAQLIQALSDPHEAVRAKAAQALGKLEDKGAVDKLIEVLGDPHPHVRNCAAGALGQIKSRKAVKPLIEGLKDEDAGVRKNCAYALGEIESSKAVDALEEIAENDPEEEVRTAAREAIKRIEHERE
jgi:HEAT repeat protein